MILQVGYSAPKVQASGLEGLGPEALNPHPFAFCARPALQACVAKERNGLGLLGFRVFRV